MSCPACEGKGEVLGDFGESMEPCPHCSEIPLRYEGPLHDPMAVQLYNAGTGKHITTAVKLELTAEVGELTRGVLTHRDWPNLPEGPVEWTQPFVIPVSDVLGVPRD